MEILLMVLVHKIVLLLIVYKCMQTPTQIQKSAYTSAQIITISKIKQTIGHVYQTASESLIVG